MEQTYKGAVYLKTIKCNCGRVCRSEEEVMEELNKKGLHYFRTHEFHNFQIEVENGNIPFHRKEKVNFT